MDVAQHAEIADPHVGAADRDSDGGQVAVLAIAGLAAGRERSREIAVALGVSTRTVDNHLASVYRKLGLTDRGQLAAALARLDGAAAAGDR